MQNHGIDQIAGYQSWRSLLFLHWRVSADAIQSLLPAGLTVETFDESAWVGLVPFSMERIRPWWSPPVPGISWFLETNVRTYVRNKNGQSGVWFFSLDANHRLAVWVARRFWHLNYVFADMRLQDNEGRLDYFGRRREQTGTSYEIAAHADTSEHLVQAASNSLEHFLLERYHLFAVRPDGSLMTGEVHHEPYSYRSAKLVNLTQTIVSAAGLDVAEKAPPDHSAFSPGVDVVVSPLKCV